MSGPTVVPFGDPKARKKWSALLFADAVKKAYFERKFIGESDNSVIQRLTDLETDAGDTIDFDLSVQLRNRPTTGDNRLEGSEENLRFFSDSVVIDQLRKAVSAGGKMSRKRTAHNMRTVARDRLGDYWSKYFDELIFIYLSGARGINEDFFEPVTYAGHATNAITAPDANHIVYGGTATSKATLAAGDKMTKSVIEKATTKARMMRATDPETANMLPVMVDGESHYVVVMSPFQEYDMRNADTTGWLEIQKALTTAVGKKSNIFGGGLGMVNSAVLHSHESAIRFSDYGAGAVKAARALFLGRQAGVIAYGSSNGQRMSWKEIVKDYENEPGVAGGTIIGVKKTTFNERDYGVMALDTAAADPNAA